MHLFESLPEDNLSEEDTQSREDIPSEQNLAPIWQPPVEIQKYRLYNHHDIHHIIFCPTTQHVAYCMYTRVKPRQDHD